MDEDAWRQLLESLETAGRLHPVEIKALDEYEERTGCRLAASYRHFCRTFGPGRIGDWFEIAVPGFTGKAPTSYDLEAVARLHRDLRDWREYADDPGQFERAILFGGDSTGAVYLWDPAERTDKRRHECAIYAVWRDWSRERVCDTFWEFANICLHRGAWTLYDEPPRVGFRAATFGRPSRPKG